ncbi:MAG TPA: kelch repeat-containing protein [Candidatus Kapabacteria bacterium]|jgi:N-acetylneuraminic acid mutarotase|nr:kelch repeat-containing protein [Candidatus Kapabacteria bacterium]
MAFRRILLVLSISIVVTSIASSQSWKYIAPMKHARSWHRAILLQSNKILVIGGTDGFTALNSCELYDPLKDVWSDAGSLNVPRYRFQACLLDDGRVFVAGGLTDMGVQTTATCEIFDPSANTWKMTATMSDPREEFEACAIPGNKIVLIGGLDANKPHYLNSVDLFDVATETITALPPQPEATSTVCAIYSSQKNAIFTFGGNQDGFGGFKGKMTQKFSLDDGNWSNVDSMIDRQGAQFNTIVNPISNEIYLFTNDTAYPLRLTSDVEALDPSTGHWHLTGTITPRTDPRAILIDDSIALTGGIDAYNHQISNCSWYSFITNKSREGTPLLEPLTAHSNIYLAQQDTDGCAIFRKLLVIGGETTGGISTPHCELLDLGKSFLTGMTIAETHRSSASSYFGHPDSLPLLIDVNPSMNLDSLWPYFQTISGTYAWDSSVVQFAGYLPPNGWTVTGLTSHGNSEDISIQNISSQPTHPLSIGTALFLPRVHTAASRSVALAGLSFNIGDKTLSQCISANEDGIWSVYILGDEGVTRLAGETSSISIQSIEMESGKVEVVYYAPWLSSNKPRFEVYDMLGRCVSVTENNPEATTISIDVHQIPSGAYLLRLIDGAAVTSKIFEIKR